MSARSVTRRRCALNTLEVEAVLYACGPEVSVGDPAIAAHLVIQTLGAFDAMDGARGARVPGSG